MCTLTIAEVHFGKEVRTTLADYSFGKRKKRHEAREGQQTKWQSLTAFLRCSTCKCKLVLPFDWDKKGPVSGNYWHPVKRSGNNYAGSRAHHLCAVQYSFSQLCCSLILSVNTWSSTMPAQSDKSEEPEKLLLRPALFFLTTESRDCLQHVMVLWEMGKMSMPPVMIIGFLSNTLFTFFH